MNNNKKFYNNSITNGLVYLKTLRSFCINIQLSFLKQNDYYIKIAESFYQELVNLSNELLKSSKGMISKDIIDNKLLITEYTLPTYLLTEKLFKVKLPTNIVEEELKFQPGEYEPTYEEVIKMYELNKKIITVISNFKDFLTEIFNAESSGELFSYSYPFLIRIIIGLTNIFILIVERTNQNLASDPTFVCNIEYISVKLVKDFNMFLRSFVDPSREDIILKSQSFVVEVSHLITEYRIANLSPKNQEDLAVKSKKVIDRFAKFLSYVIEQLLKNEVYLIVEPVFLDNMYHSIKIIQYFIFGIKEEIKKEIESN
ncbi:MAG: DUF2935 domain-containing protein [Bacilli bacterium]|nr:DUF2935 domain-containing protein [Bacilli bacterium]